MLLALLIFLLLLQILLAAVPSTNGSRNKTHTHSNSHTMSNGNVSFHDNTLYKTCNLTFMSTERTQCILRCAKRQFAHKTVSFAVCIYFVGSFRRRSFDLQFVGASLFHCWYHILSHGFAMFFFSFSFSLFLVVSDPFLRFSCRCLFATSPIAIFQLMNKCM